MSKGVIISKEGSTVKDGQENQYVDTDTPLFKLYLSDGGQKVYTGQTFTGGSPDTIVIQHNLGYQPMYFFYMDRADNSQRKLVLNEDTAIAGTTILVTSEMDKNNIYVQITGSGITGTFGYNYQVYYDKVSQ